MVWIIVSSVGAAIALTLIIIGWVYYSKIIKAGSYKPWEKLTSLLLAIFGIFIPLLNIGPPIIYAQHIK